MKQWRTHVGWPSRHWIHENAAWFGAFPKSIQQYRARYPNVGLGLHPMFSTEPVCGYRRRARRAIPCPSHRLPGPGSVEAVPRRYGKSGARCAGSHLWGSHGPAPRLCRASCQRPCRRVVTQYLSTKRLLSLVSAGIGILLQSANAGRKPPLVELVPVVDFDLKLPLCFVWNQSNSSAALSAFRSVVSHHQDRGRHT